MTGTGRRKGRGKVHAVQDGDQPPSKRQVLEQEPWDGTTNITLEQVLDKMKPVHQRASIKASLRFKCEVLCANMRIDNDNVFRVTQNTETERLIAYHDDGHPLPLLEHLESHETTDPNLLRIEQEAHGQEAHANQANDIDDADIDAAMEFFASDTD